VRDAPVGAPSQSTLWKVGKASLGPDLRFGANWKAKRFGGNAYVD